MNRVLMAGAAAVALPAGLAVVARSLLATVTVRGGSMTPTLNDGDVLLVLRHPRLLVLRHPRLLVLRHRRRVRAGRIVVVQRPDRELGWTNPLDLSGRAGWYVKRVAAAPGDPVPSWVAGERPDRVPPGMLALRGDHPGSEDSKQWGLCPAERMYGVVLVRLRAA
ncbi:S26 family signal peptidase [Actinomadura gamaensis]|uniref:Mitochondrial inner membrane protease subunit 2 n=1 Tax=Actinomadura gamaensis TaxID=1763541 RepID=A0ABV9TVU1_9ACTN